MGAPIGAVVKLYCDTAHRIQVGEFIQTPTGRTYQVLTVRMQTRGKHAGRRQHMSVLVVPESTPTSDDVVIPIVWYSRRPERASSRR